ncbi:hypothetical protein J5N97_004794 [Dioscorea zingiberensis]|uniref:Protodermal factor 1 n=1 Tax=Dioscorea zingiberensis TaxID=325984 RepID=A0A9D5D916_9LILI|nr:hypothetical protein J5N97_004794 [Dioscorea zingiberensis]
METIKNGKAFLICFLFSVLVSQEVATLATDIADTQTTTDTFSPVLCHSPKRSHRKPPCDDPSPSPGGSHGTPTPSHPSGGYYNSPPSYGNSPPSPPGPVDPGTRTPPVVPLVPPTPTTTPGIITTPPSPLIPDPNTPPLTIGPVIYWRTHPAAIWAIFGYWGTIGSFFGVAATSTYGSNLSLQEALANTRRDGIGALLREGTASFLNSMVSNKFAFSPQQVRDAFIAASVSNKSAAAQAELFKQANEGHFMKNK